MMDSFDLLRPSKEMCENFFKAISADSTTVLSTSDYEETIDRLKLSLRSRTFTQQIIDRKFPHPLKSYGSPVWAVGRMSDMFAKGLLK